MTEGRQHDIVATPPRPATSENPPAEPPTGTPEAATGAAPAADEPSPDAGATANPSAGADSHVDAATANEPDEAQPEADTPDGAAPEAGPDAAEPDVAAPEAAAADPAEADAAESDAAKSDAAQADAAEPDAAQADAAEPDAAQADATEPGAEPVADGAGVEPAATESAEAAAVEPAPVVQPAAAALPVDPPSSPGTPGPARDAAPGEDDTPWKPRPWMPPAPAQAPASASAAAVAATVGSAAAAAGAAPTGSSPTAPTRISAHARASLAQGASDDPTAVLAPVGALPRARSTVAGQTEAVSAGNVPRGVPVASASAAAPTDRSRPTGAASAAGSPMDVFPSETRGRRWPRTLAILAALLVVLGGAYVGALWLWSDRVPPGATVAGVEIGGMPADRAVATAEETLRPATAEPVPVAAGENRTTLDPSAAGLTFDARATVDSVTGFGLEPVRLWRQLFGIGAVQPVTSVDDDALGASVGELADSLAVEPVNGTVVFVDGQASWTDAADGASLDEAAAADTIRREWLTGSRPLELPTVVTPPAITQSEVDRVLDEVARPLVRAPITVAVGDQLAELPTSVIADAASFTPDGDTLTLALDGEMLVEAVTARTTNLLTEPSDASFVFQDGAPVVVPGTPGTTLDPDALAAAVEAAGTGTDRTARVELVERDPQESTEALQALGITQIVSEFSTPLNSEPRRTANIINGASKINGVLVRPGETFSLTEALGPIDAAHGFVEAGAIVNGEHTDAWGGGLSQVSTTTYNAAYLAGFEDVEHHPHSEWFSRYPEGREATIFTGQLDMQWKNNTPYGALIQSWVDGGRVFVRVWGTAHWTVESSTSGRSGIVAPTTVYSQSPTCEPQATGNPGFTVTVTRRLLLAGEEKDKESWTVRYKPQNEVICGEPPAPAAPPPPAP